ncbi:unnamed protein product [Dicrocoelium dendriticum]|nr:unnamed protein product [Dicrocoelium dendriticum]
MAHAILETILDFCTIILTVGWSVLLEAVTNLWALLFPTLKDLTNETVLVTGAGNGIGRLMCLEFAKYCPNLVGWDVDLANLEHTVNLVAKERGCLLRAYVCDLRSREDIMNTAKRVLQEVGRVTILVNNAGVLSARPILDLTPEDIEDTFKVNVLSHFYTIQAFLPSMIGDNKPNLLNYSGDEARIAPSGHIVAVLSVASFIPCVGLSDYCATKSAALMLSESLELELSEKGLHNQIYVTRVFPFLLNTRMFAGCKPRLPWLFDIVDAEYCARAIVNSVRTNRREVFVHNRYKLLPLIKCLLPDRALRCLYNLTNTRQLISQRNKFVSTVNS